MYVDEMYADYLSSWILTRHKHTPLDTKVSTTTTQLSTTTLELSTNGHKVYIAEIDAQVCVVLDATGLQQFHDVGAPVTQQEHHASLFTEVVSGVRVEHLVVSEGGVVTHSTTLQ